MTLPDDLDRSLRAWLAAEFPSGAPRDLLPEAVVEARRAGRRPSWRIPERWIPMRLSFAMAAVPRAALVLITLAVLTALAAGTFALASGGQTATGVSRPASNGLISYADITTPWTDGWDLWLLDPDGEAVQVTAGTELDFGMRWSPDGRHLVFWSIEPPTGADGSTDVDTVVRDGNVSIKVLDVADDDPATAMSAALEPRVLVSGLRILPQYNMSPSWSPDSQRLAYGHVEDGIGVIDIVSAADPGSEPMRLIEGHSPSWSPSGDRIAYRTGSYPGGGALWSVAPDGTGAMALSTVSGSGFDFTDARWAPDGQRIVYQADGDIWVVGQDGVGESAVSTDPAADLWPSFSPDGTWIAFQRLVPSGDALDYVTVDVDKGDPKVIDAPVMGNVAVVWSPDSEHLLAARAAARPGETEIVLVDPSDVDDPRVLDTVAADTVDLAWQPITA